MKIVTEFPFEIEKDPVFITLSDGVKLAAQFGPPKMLATLQYLQYLNTPIGGKMAQLIETRQHTPILQATGMHPLELICVVRVTPKGFC